jgi:hypothetical protein
MKNKARIHSKSGLKTQIIINLIKHSFYKCRIPFKTLQPKTQKKQTLDKYLK